MGVGNSDRCQVTGDRRQVAHKFVITFSFSPLLSVSVRFGIIATIRTHCKIQCQEYFMEGLDICLGKFSFLSVFG